MTDFSLLKQLCSIHAPSGNERAMTDFLLQYIQQNKPQWKTTPIVFHGEGFQDCVVLVFGKPRTAVFAHIDSVGFTVRYDNKVVAIGSPETETGFELSGKDSKGAILTKLVVSGRNVMLDCQRPIERGTTLVFAPNFKETENYVQSCYLDNRLGVWTALQLCETIENGIIVFSCYEEHGGGTMPFLLKFIMENYPIYQALVCDITWITQGVTEGKGVAISMRDSRIPRKVFVDRIIQIAEKSGIAYQLEVEDTGGSDGKEVQSSPYPIDWCFVGAPEDNVHSPYEKVHKADIVAMLQLYQVLMQEL
jgi:putative aminopeptidase FrvX